jgi:hypothetical protein
MPVFELQTQDGRTFEVDAPDQETALHSLEKHSGSKPSALEKAFEPITSIPSTYMGMVDEAKSRMGRGAKQMGEGEGFKRCRQHGAGRGRIRHIAVLGADSHNRR